MKRILLVGVDTQEVEVALFDAGYFVHYHNPRTYTDRIGSLPFILPLKWDLVILFPTAYEAFELGPVLQRLDEYKIPVLVIAYAKEISVQIDGNKILEPHFNKPELVSAVEDLLKEKAG